MKKTKAPPKPPIDYEISPPPVLDETWTFRSNGELITWTEYNRLLKEHEQWVKQLATEQAAALQPEKKTRKRKA